MNILYLSPYVPELRASHAGGVCMGKEVEFLKQNHNLFVLTFCNDKYEEKLLSDHPDFQFIRTSRIYFIRMILTHLGMPNLFALRSGKKFKKLVCQIIEENHIDAVHAEYTQMGQYVWIKEKYPHIKFYMVAHDVVLQSYERQSLENSGLLRIWSRIEKEKVKRYEGKYVRSADLVFTFNEKDKSLIHEYYGIKNVKVINPYYGIDFRKISHNGKKEKAICFVGQMGRSENHIAAMRLIRIFKEMNVPGWKLNIIGANPREELKKENSEQIHITGFVDDINSEIGKNEIAVFPLTVGAGIKFKVLLTFGLGVPVVTTSIGAEGIDPDGNVLILAETDVEIKRHIEELIRDEAYRLEKSKESVDFVRRNFDWKTTEEVFSKIYG